MDGGCTCGAVRYTLTGPPMIVHCCHCTQCQKISGAAFAVNAIIEGDRIQLHSGKLVVTPGPSESGRPHDIYRCEKCMTSVWADYGRRPNYRFVRVGTLDEPSRLPPDVHIFVRSKLPWVQLPASAKAYDVFYEKLEDVWTPEAIARRKAALATAPSPG